VGGGCDSLRRARVVGKRGTARREDPRDPWENGSRRADSPRSNASLDSFSQPVCAATSSSLPPIGPPSDPARPRARARRLSHPRASPLPAGEPADHPPTTLASLSSALTPARAHRETAARPTHLLRGYMGARMEMFSDAADSSFYFPSRNICALDLTLWSLLFLPSYFFLLFFVEREY